MAADGKKKFTVDTEINFFGETRTKKAPDWFVASPKLSKMKTGIPIKRDLELDPRKWKKKDLEDGVYAVARYELALAATVMSGLEKDIQKAMKAKKEKKFTKDTKKLGGDIETEIGKAEAEFEKLHKKLSKTIKDKVSLALDGVESDDGDNKKALAMGKEALKRFDNLDTDNLFKGTTLMVVKLLADLARDVAAEGEGAAPKAFRKAQSAMSAAEKDFLSKAKSAQNAMKYLMDQGGKMAKDKKAAPELQKVGAKLSSGPVKSAMQKVSAAVDDYESSLKETADFIKSGAATSDAVKSHAKDFAGDHKDKDRAVAAAAKTVKPVGKEFDAAMKKLKK